MGISSARIAVLAEDILIHVKWRLLIISEILTNDVDFIVAGSTITRIETSSPWNSSSIMIAILDDVYGGGSVR